MNDRYLKGVLTVIAGALVWIAVQLTMGPVHASRDAQLAEPSPSAKPLLRPEPSPMPVFVVNPFLPKEVIAYASIERPSLVSADGTTAVNQLNNRYLPVYCVNCAQRQGR